MTLSRNFCQIAPVSRDMGAAFADVWAGDEVEGLRRRNAQTMSHGREMLIPSREML
jgi:hypothetical protein